MTRDAAPAEAASTCLDDEEVLAFAGGRLSSARRELAHAHLDACELCQEVLNEAVRSLATAKTAGFAESDEVAWSTTFRPGMVVSRRYEIRKFIARGGMGEVYDAFDRELQQRVALKTVTSTACDNPSAVRRLKAEVQLARRVSHPNVCRIYDFGTHVTGSGAPISFLTMEFVDGETLGTRIRRGGALPIEEARALGRQLLRGLAAAHEAGVLHRDFKCDNVILRRADKGLEPLILDFGLARALDQAVEHSSASGRGLVGTLAYMAPDQLEGKPYTTASDVYSFGLVWFEMLTGELPFKPRSSPAVTTLDRLTKPVPAPSSKNPSIPRDLDAVVLACLRRSASERLQTAAEVLARLDQLEQQARSPVKRRKALPLAIVAGLLLVISYLAFGRHPLPAPAAPDPIASLAGAHVVPSPLLPVATLAREAATSDASVAAAPGAVAPPALASAAPSKSKPAQRAKPLANRSEPALPAASAHAWSGWENPFSAAVPPPSAKLGAVLDQPLNRSASPGDSQFPEGSR